MSKTRESEEGQRNPFQDCVKVNMSKTTLGVIFGVLGFQDCVKVNMSKTGAEV